MRLGRPDKATRYFDEALALARDLQGPRGSEVASFLMDKATALVWQEDLQEAENVARESVDIYSTAFPRLHPERWLAQSRLGEVLRLRHNLKEASPLLREALSAHRQMFGENNRRAADNLDSLAKIAREQHQLAEAEALARQALETQLRAEGAQHARTGYYRNSLGMIQIERREYAEAEAQLRASLTVFANTLPPDHPYVASTEYFLGEVMLATHRPKEAETLFQAAMSKCRRAREPEWRAARSASGLGEALYRQGRFDEAETYLVDSYRILAADPNADEGPRVAARERVVRFYTERAQHDRLQIVIGTAHAQASPAANRTDRL